MAAVLKRNVRSWMLVYVGFVVTLGAAHMSEAPDSDLAMLSPGTLPSEMTSDKTFFRPAIAQPRRNDI